MEQRHDHKAVLKAALDEHLEPMVRLASEFAPSTHEAEDIVEGAFLAVCSDMNGNPDGNEVDVKDRLYRSLVDSLVDRGLGGAASAKPSTPGKLTLEFAGTAHPVKSLRMLMSRVDGSDVYRVISDLPEEQRLLTLLYYLAGFTQRQVARLTNLSLPQVRRRLGKSRQRLHDFIWQRSSTENREAIAESR